MTNHQPLHDPKPVAFSPGEKCDLTQIPTRPDVGEWNKELAEQRMEENVEEMAQLARTLYAENRQAVLLVLQGMDTAGKDSTIRNVMRGVNPRSCKVVSFKKPSEEELDHDFLWRIHKNIPRKGHIGIFNRSHYEDVLIVRVHSLVPKHVWKQRYDQINDFEKMLIENGTKIVKCCLHVGKDRQRERLQERIDDPRSHWKFNPADLEERKLWDQYQEAYSDAITKCNTKHAPWHVVPADRKWFRNLIVSELLLKTLRELDPKIPDAQGDWRGIVVK